MIVHARTLQRAVELVRVATGRLVERKVFQSGVLGRLDQWISRLPNDTTALAKEIGRMAAQGEGASGAVINGRALDEVGEPSLERLVLHYANKYQDLFQTEYVEAARAKLKPNDLKRVGYAGVWPD